MKRLGFIALLSCTALLASAQQPRVAKPSDIGHDVTTLPRPGFLRPDWFGNTLKFIDANGVVKSLADLLGPISTTATSTTFTQAVADGLYRKSSVSINWNTDMANKPTDVGAFGNSVGYQTGTQVANAITAALAGRLTKTEADNTYRKQADQQPASTISNFNAAARAAITVTGPGASYNQNTGELVFTAGSGAAGGDLVGNFPNPTLAPVGAAGTYGGNGQYVQSMTMDTKGRVTGVTVGTPASTSAVVPTYDSLYIVGGSGATRLYKVVSTGSVVSTSVAGYGARYQTTAPEFDTTGVGYTVINVAATEAALNSAITSVGSAANRYLKLPAGATLTVNGSGINISQNINNLVIDLNGSKITSGSSNRVGLINVGSGAIRGLAVVNGTVENTKTTAQANGAGYSGYGVIGFYEGASIQGATYNGKFVPGLRLKNLTLTAPALDYDLVFGNTYSPLSVGGNGQGNLHRDLIFEDLNIHDCGSAGIEYLAHRWDDNDTTTVDLRNVTGRRIAYANLGLVSGKNPKFGPAVSLSGRHEVALFDDIDGTNSSYSGVESVGGIDVTFRGNNSSASTGNMTGISMTNGGKNYDLMRYVTVVNNTHNTTGTATGRPLECYRVGRAVVQNNAGVCADAVNFRLYNSLIGSLGNEPNTANNWRVTTDFTALRFQSGSVGNYLQYNTLSNVGSANLSEVIGLITSNSLASTGNYVRYNTILRGNTSIPFVKNYNENNGAEVTGQNTLTPNP